MKVPSECFHVSILMFFVFCTQAIQSAYFRLPGSEMESMTQRLIEDNLSTTVTQILQDPNYTLTSKEKDNVEKYIASVPHLGMGGDMLEPNAFEHGSSSNTQQELMQEEWNSLREELHGFYKSPQILRWLEKQAADEQENDFGKKLEKLDALHKSLEENEPSISKNIGMIEPKYNEIDRRRKGCIEDLFNLIHNMRSDFSGSELESRYLYLQNLVFRTVYYFFKYKMITPEELQSLFNNHGTIEDLSRHVFISYKLDQQVSSKLVPQSSKNVLNFWYYYPLRDMLDGLGSEYKEKFSTHYNKLGFAYYKMNPEYKNCPELNRILIECSTSLLNEDDISGHITSYDPDTQIYQALPSKNQAFENLIYTFTNFHKFDKDGRFCAELAYLFQLIENQKEYHPYLFEEIKQENLKEFQEMFQLMSSSTYFLSRLENIRIYLEKNFAEFAWSFPFNYSTGNKEISKRNFEELKIFAKYLRILQLEIPEKNKNKSPGDPLYRYSQVELINSQIKDIKSKIISSSKYYEDYISKASNLDPSSWLDSIAKGLKNNLY